MIIYSDLCFRNGASLGFRPFNLSSAQDSKAYPLLFCFQVEVAVHVTQAEYSRTFTFQTKLSGPVLLTCRKKGTRKAIQTQTAQLSEILKQCKGPWKITGNEVTITTEGEVDLHYFTDEKTLMEEEEEGSRGGCRDGRGGAPRYSRR